MLWHSTTKRLKRNASKNSLPIKEIGDRIQDRHIQEEIIDKIIDNLVANNFTNQELEQYLESPNVLVKANAVIAVFRNQITENSIIQKMNSISQNIQNEPKVLGVWTTGHLAMAVLYLLNTSITLGMYNDNTEKLDKYTKEDIEHAIEQIVLSFG